MINEPLFMPKGSVRALIILLFTITTCYLTIRGTSVPENMWDIIHIGISFYFGMKVGENLKPKGGIDA